MDMLQVKIIFRLFYFKLVFLFSNQVNLSQPCSIFFQTRSTCFDLNQFGEGKKTQVTGQKSQVRSHRLLFYQYRNNPNCLHMPTLIRPKNFCLGLIRPKVSFNECLGYFLYWQAMTCDLWPVTCDL